MKRYYLVTLCQSSGQAEEVHLAEAEAFEEDNRDDVETLLAVRALRHTEVTRLGGGAGALVQVLALEEDAQQITALAERAGGEIRDPDQRYVVHFSESEWPVLWLPEAADARAWAELLGEPGTVYTTRGGVAVYVDEMLEGEPILEPSLKDAGRYW